MNKKLVQKLEIEHLNHRLETEKFLLTLLIVLSGWIVFTSIVTKYAAIIPNIGILSSPAIVAIFLASIFQVKRSKRPLSFYGLTFKNWKKNALEAFLFTLPILVLATIIKIIIVKKVPQVNTVFIHFTSMDQLKLSIVYLCLVPFQEFVARGCFQSSIKSVLTGTHAVFVSIILSSVIFAAFHAFISPEFALVALTFGLFWGWLYARQGSIVGCSVSHFLLGAWCLIALDYEAFLRKMVF